MVDGDRVSRVPKPSQRDLRTPERMKATQLAEPTSVGDAPLSADLLRSKSAEDRLK
jgi:hypothetical protein